MKIFPENKILIATHNIGKLEEFKYILKDLDLEILSSKDLNLDEPIETENTFIGNARIKSKSSCLQSNIPSLADDSGLQVHALGNKPGVYTADWAFTENGRDFKKAMHRVWNELLECKKKKPFTANFICTLVLTFPNGNEKIFEGSVNGSINWPIRGIDGHGYDPMFVPDGYRKTFGEMTNSEKNKISHRNIALKKFITFYNNNS
ncbi:MAG: RdgB/HAM1 family non-canonical purine NTP pyrophosphatase [Paracoccaceae bacterium]